MCDSALVNKRKKEVSTVTSSSFRFTATSPAFYSTATPPQISNPPPADSTNSPPPQTSTNTPSPPPLTPPADSETPPGSPNEPNNPPPYPDVQSPPPPPSTNPETPPPESSTATPSEQPNLPPTPPSDPTNSPPVQPSPPTNSPPPSSLLPPAKSNGGPVLSPSVPSRDTPPTNNTNGNSYQGKSMVSMAVSGVAIMALVAIAFLVRRNKKRNIDSYAHSHYLPHPNFSVESDGFFYGQDHSKVYSGPGGSMYNSQQQQQYSSNSYGSQRGHQMHSSDSAILGTSQTHFSYEDLAKITQGFARHSILGEGGFGCLYKGTLHDGRVVAVKQLKAGSGQGESELKAEVEIISCVHHRHLVSLVGYCISDQHRLLIYE
ncbi:unnamed protein product [Eruca vesicaria subsp. sativa]|uniref:non-specific serine/threonine protein kinase n=1 Tax=Eruca vesicaria subsp. sativa TaxID=29727 RepID=A0ABC8JIN3_ERUVS|nr:unnamed protein product [Eruca vesicaria subsp. sativa]